MANQSEARPAELGRLATFASPELESAYREAELAHDVKLVRAVVVVYLLSNVPFGMVDRAFEHDPSRLHLVYAGRVLVSALAVLIAWYLPRMASPAARDRALLLWAAALTLANVPMILSRPTDFGGPLASTLLVIVGWTLVLPASFGYQLASVALLAGGFVATREAQGAAGTAALASTAGLLASGLAISLLASHRLQRSKRERFQSLREEISLRGELEQALAEIRTLRGILPICVSCHKIRDETGAWQRVETYVSSHTHAQFSHGYCPACEGKFLSEDG
jgi:hypothetical protein